MSLRTPLSLALLASLALCSADARANSALFDDRGQAAGPFGAPMSRLEVAEEHLTLDCAAATAQRPVCHFEATYRIINPTEEEQHGVAAFYGERLRDVHVTQDGREVGRALTPPEVEALDAIVRGLMEGHHDGRMVDGQREGFEVLVAPGAASVLKVTGELRAGFYGVRGYGTEGHYARHLLLGTPPRDTRHDLSYLLAPVRAWASVGPIHVTIHAPTSWGVEPRLSFLDDGGQQPTWAQATEGDRQTWRATVPAAAHRLNVTLRSPEPTFAHGGPVLGVGGAWGRRGGRRLRGGWEVAAPTGLLWSLSADTDLGDWLVVTPMAEAITPSILIIPSLGAGLGVPVRLRPDTSVGVRGQLSAMFGPLGLSFSVDLYPGDLGDDAPDPLQLSLLFQGSF